MNNKLISYEDAVKQLKDLEVLQRYAKIAKRSFLVLGKDESKSAKKVHQNKLEINKLLTIIHLHKETRKMYYLLNHYIDVAENEG